MARYKFGGTAQDGVYSKFAFAGKSLLALADATVTAWTAKTGGTQYTDLLDAAGNPVTSIKVSDGQLPEFSGPDGVTELWIDDGDSERHLLVNRQVGPAGPAGPGGSDAGVAGYIDTAGSASRAAVEARAQATLDTHLNDTVDAHDATAISYAGSTNLAATNVEAALDELDTEKAAVGASGIIAYKAYNPGTLASYTTTATALADVDATNLAVTFTTPPSGRVLVRLEAVGGSGGTVNEAMSWGLREAAATIAPAAQVDSGGTDQAANEARTKTFVLTGLTPGSAHTYKWAWQSNVGTNTSRLYAGANVGAAVMEVHALP